MSKIESKMPGEIFAIHVGKRTTWRISQDTDPAPSKRTFPGSTPVLPVCMYVCMYVYNCIYIYNMCVDLGWKMTRKHWNFAGLFKSFLAGN